MIFKLKIISEEAPGISNQSMEAHRLENKNTLSSYRKLLMI